MMARIRLSQKNYESAFVYAVGVLFLVAAVFGLLLYINR